MLVHRGGPREVLRPSRAVGPQPVAERGVGQRTRQGRGQPGRVTHAEAFRIALRVLANAGFTQAEIDMMTKQNPARFLGLK